MVETILFSLEERVDLFFAALKSTLVMPVVALSCTCPFPIWYLGQDVEFDCIYSGSLPFY